MATNPPAGDGHRKGKVRKRSHVRNPLTGKQTKRNTKTREFLDQNADEEKFKGVRRENMAE
jgi:hypothetical protein